MKTVKTKGISIVRDYLNLVLPMRRDLFCKIKKMAVPASNIPTAKDPIASYTGFPVKCTMKVATPESNNPRLSHFKQYASSLPHLEGPFQPRHFCNICMALHTCSWGLVVESCKQSWPAHSANAGQDTVSWNTCITVRALLTHTGSNFIHP